MIAAISMMKRRPDLTLAQFRKHWLDPHGVMTAELPRVRRYLQSHCIEHPATNELARTLGIDGFPELWFDSIEDRRVAYTSPRIAECNIDSELFVGAVCRLVTEPLNVVSMPAALREGGRKIIILGLGLPDPSWPAATQKRIAALPGVVGYSGHRLIEQAAAPNSRIPELKVPVAGIAEAIFEDDAALSRSADAVSGAVTERTAIFVVEDTVFI